MHLIQSLKSEIFKVSGYFYKQLLLQNDSISNPHHSPSQAIIGRHMGFPMFPKSEQNNVEDNEKTKFLHTSRQTVQKRGEP